MENIKKQKIEYDKASIYQQAQIYNNEYRVLMEYIDNSIDAAEVYFDQKDSYKKEIEICIKKSKEQNKLGVIIIEDNCVGYKINFHKPFTIFHSEKRNDSRTNGMYGFGMFSYLSICHCLELRTKTKNSNTYHSFEIPSKIFTNANASEPEIEIKMESVTHRDNKEGTVITLSQFNSTVFEEFDMKTLQSEIEKHFESILLRKKFSIKLINTENKISVCKAFQYSKYCDTPYEKILTILKVTDSKKNKTEKQIDVNKTPIRIYLAVSKNTDLNREPFLVIKGRRVIEISKVEQFRTTKKSAIWSRANVSGYIDVTGVLIPNPTRKDFQKTELSKAFFYTLCKLEAEIENHIIRESTISLSHKMKDLENKVNKLLSEYLKYNTNLESLYDDIQNYNEYEINGYNILTNTNSLTNKITILENGIKKYRNKRKARQRDKKTTIKFPSDNFSNETKAGILTFRIDNMNEPSKNIKGEYLRSIIRDSVIILFQKHNEFQKRLPSGKPNFTINDKILHYIVMEIVTHLKKDSLNAAKSEIESYNILVNFASTVYELEEAMKSLVGEKI